MTMQPTFDIFIDGRWRSSGTGQTFEDENPAFRGTNLGLFQSSGPEDIDQAIGAAEIAFRTWRSTPVPERQQYVSRFLELLKASREELARIVTLENGKTIRESRAEVDSALVEGSYHLNQVSAFYGHTGPSG
jgi:acyl-CoA reductase-like NAD-dependent aldehyde dehydrogenase